MVFVFRAAKIPLFLAILAIPVSDVAGGPPASGGMDDLRFAQMNQSFMESLKTVVAGEPKKAALQAGEAAIGYWWPTIGERAPEWAKRFEFELDVQQDDKPTWSLLTVQPLFQSEDKQNTVFTQLRIARDFTFDSHRTTTNAGLGYRRLVWGERILLGVNVFLDHEFDNEHTRVGGGGEARWSGYDLYFNFYEAISSERTVGTGITERALDGYDVELTSQIPYLPWARGRGKYFHFDSVAQVNNIDGYSASLEMDLQQNLQFEVGYSHDDVTRDGFWFAQFRFRLGGGNRPVLASTGWIDAELFRWRDMREHTLDKVRRDNTIVIERTTAAGAGSFSVTISRGT